MAGAPQSCQNASVTGYLHPGYAQALLEFGTPTEMRHSGAWFLQRRIPGCAWSDGTGCYPYLACQDWSMLASDLDHRRHELVSFAATPDPFGAFTLADLQRAFPDHLQHFKEHHIADLHRPLQDIVSTHHRRQAEKALRQVDVECTAQPLQSLDEWTRLFDMAAAKFHITGMRAFSRAAFARHLALPGVFMSLARHQGEVIAAHIQMVHGDAAYAHLAAQNDTAYKLGAAFALYHAEVQYFADKVRWIDWGGEVGLAKDGRLSSFKRGWSTETRPVYFGGRIFDRERYDAMARARQIGATGYFPAYREGEHN
jgi:hypothetical protein